MAYKDKETQKNYQKDWVRQKRTISNKGSTIEVDVEKAAKLLMICKSLDKEVTGLDGKRVNLLSMVRYGVSGPTMESVKVELT